MFLWCRAGGACRCRGSRAGRSASFDEVAPTSPKRRCSQAGPELVVVTVSALPSQPQTPPLPSPVDGYVRIPLQKRQ